MGDRLRRLDAWLLGLWERSPVLFNVAVALTVLAVFGAVVLAEKCLDWWLR